MIMAKNIADYQSLNRSFARRIGKHLSASQCEFLQHQLPLYLVDPANIAYQFDHNKPLFLEIGFGMGEHLVNQLSLNPTNHYIGCEPYLNGVANLLKLAKAAGANNYTIWPDDVDLILNKLPDESLSGVYILFPDPWPKTRQQKRRLVNKARLNIIYTKLKPQASLYFASDIYDYAAQVSSIITMDTKFTIHQKDELVPHAGYIITKYHSKATANNLQPKFLQFIKA